MCVCVQEREREIKCCLGEYTVYATTLSLLSFALHRPV